MQLYNAKLSFGMDTKDSRRIFLWVEDSNIVRRPNEPLKAGRPAGPGLEIVFSSNFRSRDYNPRYYNRLAALLRAAGEPAPEHDAPYRSRRIPWFHRSNEANEALAEAVS